MDIQPQLNDLTKLWLAQLNQSVYEQKSENHSDSDNADGIDNFETANIIASTNQSINSFNANYLQLNNLINRNNEHLLAAILKKNSTTVTQTTHKQQQNALIPPTPPRTPITTSTQQQQVIIF